MRIRTRIVFLLLVLCMLLSACGQPAAPAEESQTATAAPTEVTEAPVVTEPEPTEAPQAAAGKAYELKETVLPTGNEATGTLKFYFNDKAIYAGAPVSAIIDLGVHTYMDLSKVLQPWHMSENIRVRVDLPDTEEKDEPLVFFFAINASSEPKPVSECMIYSITINCEKGVSFGSGNESEPFVTYTTKLDEILEVYGEPTHTYTYGTYDEITYYKPFNSVTFSFKGDVVRQVTTFYGENIFGAQVEAFDHELTMDHNEQDCAMLMAQYLDVTAYLPEKEEEAEATEPTKATEATEPEEETEESKVGILASIDEFITVDGKKIEFGVKTAEMPAPWNECFQDISLPITRNYYVQSGRNTGEEFYLINSEGMSNNMGQHAVVKGIITHNRNYVNWGFEYDDCFEFEFMDLTQDTTLEEVLELFGNPMEIKFESGARACFAWLHYAAENGNTLRIRVDPVLNQVIEVRVSKYFENERTY